MAYRWNKTKKKAVLRIGMGKDQGRSRCLAAHSKRSCSREQDREIDGLIDVLGKRKEATPARSGSRNGSLGYGNNRDKTYKRYKRFPFGSGSADRRGPCAVSGKAMWHKTS
jgi:hypothetical protein